MAVQVVSCFGHSVYMIFTGFIYKVYILFTGLIYPYDRFTDSGTIAKPQRHTILACQYKKLPKSKSLFCELRLHTNEPLLRNLSQFTKSSGIFYKARLSRRLSRIRLPSKKRIFVVCENDSCPGRPLGPVSI